MTVLYRPHRAMLHDAMREQVEINDFAQLVRHLNRTLYDLAPYYPKEDLPTEANTKLEPYGYDGRINWDTYLVTVNGKAWGYTNGPLPDRTDL